MRDATTPEPGDGLEWVLDWVDKQPVELETISGGSVVNLAHSLVYEWNDSVGDKALLVVAPPDGAVNSSNLGISLSGLRLELENG